MKYTQNIDLGSAVITSGSEYVAGTYATVRFLYTVGHPIDDTGFIKIVFRYAGDFAPPQFDDPVAAHYCSVQTSGNCRLQPRWDGKGHTRPWGFAIYLKVMGGYLDRGDQVTLIFGDTSGGSPGWRLQSFCEDTFEFKTLVDPIATYEFKELPESPCIRIVAGAPARAVCIAPSELQVGESFSVCLKLEDVWGNPVTPPDIRACTPFTSSGIKRLHLVDEATGLGAESNPIRVCACPGALTPRWADFHGQSEETIGTNSLHDYFTFARDIARLDIAAHQGNDFQITDRFWEQINTTCTAFNDTDRFVTFPGYEWSGNTPLGGDRNVYFAEEGGILAHSSTDLLPDRTSRYPVAATADDLFAHLRCHPAPTPFMFAHVGGRYAELAMHDDAIEVAVEIHSAWGTFEWLLHDALQHGYRVGICANSDGHKGRPGSSYPGASKFGSYGGLTCVLAPRLERSAVLAALQKRHVYATTGHRALVDLEFQDAAGNTAIMGDVWKNPSFPLNLVGHIHGTAPIANVQLWNGSTLLHTWRPEPTPNTRRFQVLWQGAEVRGRDRQVNWDGELTVEHATIEALQTVNFWNPDAMPQQVGSNKVTWRSITTGGITGLILTLKRTPGACLHLRSQQADLTVALDQLPGEGITQDCGGLGKQLSIIPLPDLPPRPDLDVSLTINALDPGDSPLYMRAFQEDGHLLWTSPMYACIAQVSA